MYPSFTLSMHQVSAMEDAAPRLQIIRLSTKKVFSMKSGACTTVLQFREK